MKKFISRHKAGTAFAAVSLIFVVVYAITITWHSRQTQAALERAEREAEKSEQVVDFMMDMFEAGDPAESLGDTVTAELLLERGIEQAEQLNDQPMIQAQMYDVVGRVYSELGEYDRAYTSLQRAIELREETGTAENDIELADTYYNLGTVIHHLGKYRESDLYFEQAIDIYNRYPDHESREYANSLYALADIRSVRSDTEEAERLHRQALQMRLNLLGNDHPDVGKSYHKLGFSLYRNDSHNSALQNLNKAREVYRKSYENRHPDEADLMETYAFVYSDQQEYDRAEEYLKRALEIQKNVYGDAHTQTGISKKNLADFYRHQGEYTTAEMIYRELLDLIEKELGSNNPLHRPVAQATGRLYMQSERPKLAQPYLQKTVELLESVLNPVHPRIVSARIELSKCMIELNRFDDAMELLRENLNRLDENDEADPDGSLEERTRDLIDIVEEKRSMAQINIEK